MSEVHLTTTFSTSGFTFSGRVTSNDVKDRISGPRGGTLSDEAADAVIGDLARRQAEYVRSRERIMEKTTVMHDSGSMAVGSGAE